MGIAKSLLFAKSILGANLSRPRSPFKLSFAITYACNMRCKMCNIWKKERSREELDLKRIEEFFRRLKNVFWLGITGGEPFLRPDVADIARLAVERCRRLDTLHFATNAQLGTRILETVAGLKRIKRPPRLVFTISLDGPRALHDSIRGAPGSWDRAVGVFRELKKTPGVKAQIGFTISEHNAGRFAEAFAELKSAWPPLKFDDINVNVFQRSSFYYENEKMSPPQPAAVLGEIARILALDRDSFSVNNFLRRTYLRLYPRFLRTGKSPLPCQALSSTCFLDPYGDLYPCAVYKKKLLNVAQMRDDFETEWSSSGARALARECAGNACPGCWSPCDAFSAIGGSLFQAGLDAG